MTNLLQSLAAAGPLPDRSNRWWNPSHASDQVDPVDLQVAVFAATFGVYPVEQALAERADGLAEQDRPRHVAVGGRAPEPHLERSDLGSSAHAGRRRGVVELAEAHRLGGLQHRLLGRDVDVLAPARPVAVVEGDESGGRRLGRGVEEGLIQRDP
jgi:hypothetical protein